jgi:hypothetical protein
MPGFRIENREIRDHVGRDDGIFDGASVSEMTEKAVISEAVPLVEGTATNLALFLRGGMEPGTTISLNSISGCS